MYSKFASRIAVTTLLTLGACLSLNAQAQAPSAPTITFALPDSVTVHQSDGVVQVAVTSTDAVGLRSAAVSGGYASACSYYPAGTKSALSRLYFYVSYFPVGDYTFSANATNSNGMQTSHNIILHLVK